MNSQVAIDSGVYEITESLSKSDVDLLHAIKVNPHATLITEITYLFTVRLASFRWQELYSGLFTELGKLHINDRLL